MAFCPRVFRRHRGRFKIPAWTYRPRRQRINVSPLRRRNSQTKEELVFHRDDWLFRTRDSSSTPQNGIQYDQRHPWNTISHQPHITLLIPRTVLRLLKIRFKIRSRGGALKRKTAKSSTKNIFASQRQRVKVHQFGKGWAHITTRPGFNKINWNNHSWHRLVWCLGWIRANTSTTRQHNETHSILVTIPTPNVNPILRSANTLPSFGPSYFHNNT